MARATRVIEAGTIYHVLNRGNGRQKLFRKPADFSAFEKVIAEGLERYPVDLLTYCLMDNHWHLVLRPRSDAALGNLMRWIGVTHVRRHHQHYNIVGGGHLYQGRFKSFPVQDDPHLLTLCCYVEANAVRAGCIPRAQDWTWGGAFARERGNKPFKLCEWPVDRPPAWNATLNREPEKSQIAELRECIKRGRPWGDAAWIKKTVKRLRLESTLRSVGRPRLEKQRT